MPFEDFDATLAFLPAYYLFLPYLVIVVLCEVRRESLKITVWRASKRDLFQMGIVFAALCVITIVHYEASRREIFWHEVFQRAYYLPIIVSALWYGLRGGLSAAGLAAVLYLPHIVMGWHGFPSYQFNQYAEVVLFFVFGGLTGALADQQRRQKEKVQETAQRLSQAYAELQVSFESLRRAERLSALGRLSAGLAHELRNPLSAIEGAFEIIVRPELDPERREEFVALIKKELARLNAMLNHFLEFARPQTPRRRPTAVRSLMQEICSLTSDSISAKGVTVRCREADFPVTMVSLDPEQIKEAILNMVINASEAMPAGGTIELSAAREADAIAINVKDEGVGVPEDQLPHIFDPFYTTKPNGTGLGLSIAHQIMEQHGGRIEVDRNPDGGMTFSLFFPLTEGGERES